MAGSSLLLLIDDIASVLDDVALMAKTAAKKVAGVIGDDLALNAEQVSGMRAEREFPVVFAVAKGSLLNKAILIPLALAINAIAPVVILPLLMIGGIYLCFEGFEKIVHSFWHHEDENETRHQELTQALDDLDQDIVAFEQEKIAGAIRTDFILSAEIIVITLGSIADASFIKQVLVLSGIGLVMTVGVYGLVAVIVKLDDVGLYLTKSENSGLRGIGQILLSAAPQLLKALTLIGMVAMFLVGGGIITHGLPGTHELIHELSHVISTIPVLGATLSALTPTLFDGIAGLIAGGISVLGVKLGSAIWQRD